MTMSTTISQPLVRRSLDFRSFDEILADVAHLRAAGYRPAGQWDLATICNHLAKGMEVGLENKKVAVPFVFRLLAPLIGKMIFKRLLKTRKMPEKIKAPGVFVPDENCEIESSIARLTQACERAKAFTGPLAIHPIFRRITPEEWQQLQLIHSSHHLAFLVPDVANA